MTTVAPSRGGTATSPAGPAPGRRRHRRFSGFGLLAVLPFALFLIIFGIYPMIQLIMMSVSDVELLQGRFAFRPVGVDNFARLASDPDLGQVVGVTVIFVIAAVVLTVGLGTALAVLLDRAPFMRRIARRVLIWPTVIAPVVVSVVWLLLLSPTIGMINKVLLALGLPQQGWIGEPVGALLAIIVVDVWHWTPLVFLLVYTALQGVDAEVLEAARVDGATEVKLIMQVVLPMIKPAVLAAAAIRLVMSVKAFDEMYLLTHGGPNNATNLISLHIRTVFFDRLEFGYGAAIGVAVLLCFAILGSGVVLARRALARREDVDA